MKLPIFPILDTKPFVLTIFTQDLVYGFHLRFKDKAFIIQRNIYLVSKSCLLSIGGSSNFHCAANGT